MVSMYTDIVVPEASQSNELLPEQFTISGLLILQRRSNKRSEILDSCPKAYSIGEIQNDSTHSLAISHVFHLNLFQYHNVVEEKKKNHKKLWRKKMYGINVLYQISG